MIEKAHLFTLMISALIIVLLFIMSCQTTNNCRTVCAPPEECYKLCKDLNEW